ncbi:PAP2 superfamily [Mycobacterium tuberculosis]|nr:PAP2 superfamily [Mycobacterium tuberculosis]
MRWGSRGWYALLFGIMVLVTVDVLADGPLRHLDWTVHAFIDVHVRGGWLTAAIVVTKLGQRGDLVVLIGVLAVAAGVRERSPRPALMSAAIVIGLSLLQIALKSAVPRTFPYGDADVLFTHGTAYPSGHTLNAFVLIWVVLELLVAAFPGVRGRLPPRRRRDISLVTGGIAAVALTLADFHWLTDVLFSLALGPVLLSGLIALAPFNTEDGRPQSS